MEDFFTGRQKAACEKLDQATEKILPPKSKGQGFLQAYYVPDTRLLDRTSRELSVRIEPLYGDEFPNPKLRTAVGLYSPEGPLVILANRPLGKRKVDFQFEELPEGDYDLDCRAGDPREVAVKHTISVVYNLDERLEALTAQIAKLDPEGTSPLRATFDYRAKAFRSLQKNRTPETNVPVHALLVELEEWDATGKAPFSYLTRRVVLTAGKRSLPCRVSVAGKALGGQRRPLVIALHGAGGSENMFYESYGAGKAVELAERRGWTIVCPKVSLFGLGLNVKEIIASLESLGVAVDDRNVFVVGHSMGARTTMQLATHPIPLRAIAALGGGGSTALSEANRGIKCFVAAGDRDLGLPSAKSLANALERAGTDVELRVYKNTEHMAIVQIALKDVFKHFDSALKKTPR